MTQRPPHLTAPGRSPSRTVVAPPAPRLAGDRANASQVDLLGLTVSVSVSPSQHLIIEVLRRPVEFTLYSIVGVNDLGLEIHGDPAGLVCDRDQIRVDVLLADLDPFGQPNAFFLELSPNRRTQRVERRAQQAIEGQSDPVVDHVFFVRLLEVLVLQALARQQAGQMLEELLHREPAVGVDRLDFQREELLFLEGRAAEGVVEDVPVPVRQHAPLDPCRAEVGGELLDVVLVVDGAPESLGLQEQDGYCQVEADGRFWCPAWRVHDGLEPQYLGGHSTSFSPT